METRRLDSILDDLVPQHRPTSRVDLVSVLSTLQDASSDKSVPQALRKEAARAARRITR